MTANKFFENKFRLLIIVIIILTSFMIAGYSVKSFSGKDGFSDYNDLTGAWKGKVQFKSGSFASVKDLEFMYIFNEGGTMMESSNYDGAPPVPPAYGIWKKTGDKQYEAKYTFYITKAPKNLEEIGTGGGWMPAGYGVLIEKITLSGEGKSFISTIKLDLFDQSGNPTDGGGEAETIVARMEF